MPLWKSEPHKPGDYELIRLRAACVGKTGGAVSEWAWHGGKSRQGEKPVLSGTNIGVFAKAIDRNTVGLAEIRTWGSPKEGITHGEFHYNQSAVRSPETLVKKVESKLRPEIKARGPELAALIDRCRGKEGDSESEWAITRINGDSHIVFFTSIPNLVPKAILRNPGALLGFTVYEYEKGQFGVSLKLDAAGCRHPATLVRPA